MYWLRLNQRGYGMFSEDAQKLMIKRSSDYHNKIGASYDVSNNPGDYSKYEVTDCATFVIRVLKDAFKANGQPDIAKQLVTDSLAKRGKDGKFKFYGDMLTKKLINDLKWKAIYITPDRFHPDDGNERYTYTTAIVNKTCMFRDIRVDYFVFDYRPSTPSTPYFQTLYSHKPARQLNAIGLAELKKIKFGYGISRGGFHTWLYSDGYVYEVHRDKIGSELYDKTAIEDFIWNSSLIVVPPDSMNQLNLKNMNSCTKPILKPGSSAGMP